jgi:hypothetical protein
MAAYTGIQGQNILIVSSDPANPTEGQIWYNTTTNLLKGYQNFASNSWASGGSLATANYAGTGLGDQNAALSIGGQSAGAPYPKITVEKYNGTSWTSAPSLNTARAFYAATTGTGTQTAGLVFGGATNPWVSFVSATESFNGTSWTTVPATLNTARPGLSGSIAGSQTATLAFGGETTAVLASSESYNGTSWTNTPSLNTARQGAGSAGTQTAALIFAGYSPPATTATESWNGSSWTTVNATNTGRFYNGGAGLQTAALAFGGMTPTLQSATELWNGTSWTSNPTGLATARSGMAAAGTQSLALSAGGNNGPGQSTIVEEWTGTQLTTRTITSS